MLDKHLPPGIQLLLFFTLMIFFSMVGDVVFQALFPVEVDPETGKMAETDQWLIYPRAALFQLFSYGLATVVFCRMTKQRFSDVIQLRRSADSSALLITFGVFVVGMIVMYGLAEVNYLLGEYLPDNYLIEYERESNKRQTELLTTGGVQYLLLNLAVLALFPAILEEIVFRGILQGKLMQASNGNVHFSVIVSSLIFAGLHMQPLKLLPMTFMAVCLGYLYHYYKDLKYSMLLHFLINGSQIVIYFIRET